MNATAKQVRVFVEVARAQSFADAAIVLHLSQPAVSLAVQNLEQIVGGKLFARSTRTLVLTPEGRAFLPTAQRLLTEWDNALADVNSLFTLRRGKLNMAVMPSFSQNLLPSIVGQYVQKYPDINLSIQDIVMEDAIASVLREHNEIAITFEAEQMDGVHFEPLFVDSFIAVYSDKLIRDDSKLAKNWRTVFEYPIVAMNRRSNVRRQVDQLIADEKLTGNIVAEANQLSTAAHIVHAGVGVGILPALCMQHIRALGLSYTALPESKLHRTVGVVTKQTVPLSSAAKRMVELLKENFNT